MNFFKKNPALSIALVVLFIVGSGVGIANIATHTIYSEGYKDGILNKFTRKGIAYKLYEGELAGGFKAGSNSLGNLWSFSVCDPEIIDELKTIPIGEVIRLHYKQYLCHTGFYGTNSYFVYKLERPSQGVN